MDRPDPFTPEEQERTARCCCGQLSIRVIGAPVLNGLCHCEDCRRRTGSAFGWSAYFPEDSVRGYYGKVESYTPLSGTGTRHFCGECGTTLYWYATGLKELVGIAGGAFVDPALPPPTASYRDTQRCGWLGLPSDWQRKG
jgi:hypothetical protein